MNAHYSLKLPVTLFITVLLCASCSSSRSAYSRGHQAEILRNYEGAMAEYFVALQEDPENIEYRMKYEQVRFAAAFDHFQRGRRAFDRDDLQTARTEFNRAVEIDPTNDLAKQELGRVDQILLNRSQNQPEPQRNIYELKEATKTESAVRQLQPAVTGPISLMLTQDSRVAFETLAELAALNVIFDTDFRSTRIAVALSNVDIYEALDILALQTNSFWQPVNRNTILISPDNQTKRREYEEHILKTIYLTNSVTATEITEAITALRTLLNMRFIAQSSAMNAILVRDTPDRIAIAEKIIEDIDKSKPEVVVEATVLEVDRSMLRQLGILPPQGTALQFTAPGASADSDTANRVNLRDIPAINSGNFSINIPESVAQFLATNSNTKLVQNPRVRATDGKLASIRIGSRVPIASGSFQPAFVGATGTPVVQFQYVDVGVNMDITPKVLLNRDISMSVVVQVQAVADERNVGGVTQPVFTNRQITHEIRLAEGETNVLGGIISDSESVSINGIPGLKEIPILKYLFGQETTRREQTEIIIVLTPHIVRMPIVSEANLRGLSIGTEVNTQLRRLASASTDTLTAGVGSPGAAPAASMPVAASTAPPPQGVGPATAELAISSTPFVIAEGGTGTVNIQMNANQVAAVELTLAFDPTSFSVIDIRDGGLLSRDGQVVSVIHRVENETGIIRVSVERAPGAPPISGNGNLVTLMLAPGARKGQSSLRVVDFRVRNAQQNVQVDENMEAAIVVQ